MSGTRELKTNIYAFDKFPNELIGPVTFIGQAVSHSLGVPMSFLIRTHPSIAVKVLDAITIAAAARSTADFIITPHKKEFLTFEITGRRATEVIKAVLKPIPQIDVETKKVCRYRFHLFFLSCY